MKVKQISVFVENKSGRLCEVTKALSKQSINIRALCIADTSDFGILRLIVNDPAKAVRVLKEEGFTVATTDIVAAEVPDIPGGLAGVLEILGGRGINIEYMYAFVGKEKDNAVVVLKMEEIEEAIAVLQEAKVKLLRESELYKF
ncbi:MAG TPA: amino acid-binding protein [Firmicutes bacterium]|jgi:hypothetical protein|nr:amino acid-binding protein [Bacillota bacterium]